MGVDILKPGAEVAKRDHMFPAIEEALERFHTAFETEMAGQQWVWKIVPRIGVLSDQELSEVSDLSKMRAFIKLVVPKEENRKREINITKGEYRGKLIGSNQFNGAASRGFEFGLRNSEGKQYRADYKEYPDPNSLAFLDIPYRAEISFSGTDPKDGNSIRHLKLLMNGDSFISLSAFPILDRSRLETRFEGNSAFLSLS